MAGMPGTVPGTSQATVFMGAGGLGLAGLAALLPRGTRASRRGAVTLGGARGQQGCHRGRGPGVRRKLGGALHGAFKKVTYHFRRQLLELLSQPLLLLAEAGRLPVTGHAVTWSRQSGARLQTHLFRACCCALRASAFSMRKFLCTTEGLRDSMTSRYMGRRIWRSGSMPGVEGSDDRSTDATASRGKVRMTGSPSSGHSALRGSLSSMVLSLTRTQWTLGKAVPFLCDKGGTVKQHARVSPGVQAQGMVQAAATPGPQSINSTSMRLQAAQGAVVQTDQKAVQKGTESGRRNKGTGSTEAHMNAAGLVVPSPVPPSLCGSRTMSTEAPEATYVLGADGLQR